MSFQGLLGGHLRLVRMLPEPSGTSGMFSGRVFPRYRLALHPHLQDTEPNRVEHPFLRYAVEYCC